MDDLLTIEEIEARYTPDWVMIGDHQPDDSPEVRAGRELFHGPDRDEVTRKAMEHPPGRYALRFLGTIPDDLVLVL